MKKYLFTILIVFSLIDLFPLFAASYDNNEFQRKSRSFSEMATKAYDEGEYDSAVEYAREAQKNADLSVAFIEKAIVRSETQTILLSAHTRLSWAKDKKAEKFFPAAFETATSALETGDGLFAVEDFEGARLNAQRALDALSVVREITPLPAFYRVSRWASSKDCLWNIASNPAIYGDPFKWENLFKANKGKLKRPSNPDLLMPGMLIAIPSIQGEYREGTYDPSVKYEPLKSQKK